MAPCAPSQLLLGEASDSNGLLRLGCSTLSTRQLAGEASGISDVLLERGRQPLLPGDTSGRSCSLLEITYSSYSKVEQALTLLYPKSQIFSLGAGRPSSRVFSSFRSLWQTPCNHSNIAELCDSMCHCQRNAAHRLLSCRPGHAFMDKAGAASR